MLADYLNQYMDYVGSNGLMLSPEQRAALQISLEIAKKNYKFNQIYFWGKIVGLNADYFIIQGVETDELMGRKSLYSSNCMDWKLLPPATDEMIERSMHVKGRFLGDPSHEYDPITVKTGDEEADLELRVKEEERLTATIEQINREAAIIPRGAFVKTPLEQIHKNRSFEGLPVTEAGKLQSYLHFTMPLKLKLKSILSQANLEESIDFLNSLEDDELKVADTLDQDKASGKPNL
ncbi:radial spoke head protein 9 homolog isoform X2 [Scyliorhinus canicula]|uniref:radial spoke head protein 9 homolog isoform X2 n=1 Tax=Scyliorhinus canicula TaxID=7830 RepID=UPI0018F79201|nr:radial spoke head protein 9 homolog isoform X2 [Scyliorhinus canicula]